VSKDSGSIEAHGRDARATTPREKFAQENKTFRDGSANQAFILRPLRIFAAMKLIKSLQTAQFEQRQIIWRELTFAATRLNTTTSFFADLFTEGNKGNKESLLSSRSSVRRISNQICLAV
ncbi:MAG TPA: hypothetical protein VG077_00965, partial [Verrucomicrobiae bacterium]|nr:hypothetical protein [Verrucomicrobiae bacterium]